MTCNNPKLDLVYMNAYIKFGKNMSVGTNVGKMVCNNPKLHPVKINAYLKFGEILPNRSHDIERK